MHYEMLSRALAYVSCLSTMSLFLTTMAMAAVSVGQVRPPSPGSMVTATIAVRSMPAGFGGLTSRAHVEAVAAVLWSKKI